MTDHVIRVHQAADYPDWQWVCSCGQTGYANTSIEADYWGQKHATAPAQGGASTDALSAKPRTCRKPREQRNGSRWPVASERELMRHHDNCQNARTCHEAGYAEGFSDAEASIRPRFATPSDGTPTGDLAHSYELGGWIGLAALVESRLAGERATTGLALELIKSERLGINRAEGPSRDERMFNAGLDTAEAILRAALASPGEGE